ncbi:MAG: SGNH/GDSL hydrolase family protein, partial [Clostridia bacterium]|nr:SGNH/GDSL hydrolase family protein [Clostridia bacterium]
LFIGNSYTYYNDMPTKIFEPIANSVGVKVKVDSITKGGWWLWNHANSDDEMGKIVDGAFKKTKYDYVILQDQSTLPIDDPGCFYDGVRNICEKVRANGATPILYCTWGRKTGSETLANRGLTHESMTWKLAAGYTAIAKELNVDVAYVGLSFTDVYTNYPTLTNLYADDLTHPSYSGSYLAALTIFTEITNIDPEEITYNGSLTGNIVSVLKQAAKKAVFETVDIPDEYKVNSEGIHYVK